MRKTYLLMMATAGMLFCLACGSQRKTNGGNDSMRKDSTRMDTASSKRTTDTTTRTPDSLKTHLDTQIHQP